MERDTRRRRPEEPERRPAPQRRRRNKRSPLSNSMLYIVMVCAVSIVLAAVGWSLANDMLALNKDKVTATIVVDDENDFGSVVDQLKDNDIIKYKGLFRLFSALSGGSDKIAQGSYLVDTDMDYRAILNSLGSGSSSRVEVSVTIQEGLTVRQIFELLEKDLEQAIKDGTTTTPFPEKFRVMFEGIPCWPKLPNLFKPLKEHGVNVTAVVYAPAFGFVYNNMDEMVRAYYKAPNSVCIEQGVDWREGICRDNKVDGVLVHYNRSCKPWSGYMAEMQRRFTKDLGVPCAGFDGDQADPRNFNEAQYETRVQGLVEAMEANQAKKEAEAK